MEKIEKYLKKYRKIFILLFFGFPIIITQINAQVPERDYILKSEMYINPIWDLDSSASSRNAGLEINKPHCPILFSSDESYKHIKILMNNPDNDPVIIVINDTKNQVIFEKRCRCKHCIKIPTNKIAREDYVVNVYHHEGKILLASQEVRKQ